MQNRVEFIDLAKGLCMIFVLLYHLCLQIPATNNVLLIDIASSFRMPFYFFLSGLFFKSYKNYTAFLLKKVNNLLIPFVFFYAVTSVLIPNIAAHIGIDVFFQKSIGLRSIYAFITPEAFSNRPLWFLWCLFIVNNLFYFIYIIANRGNNSYRLPLIILLSTSLGLIGIYLGKMNINFPAFIDSSFSAMPFFLFGYITNYYTKILYPNYWDKFIYLICIACFAYVSIFASFIDLSYNNFANSSIEGFISCGLIGSLGILLISKKIVYIPLISYIGRYSIIVLCTHMFLIKIVITIIRKIAHNEWMLFVVTLLIVLASYLFIIPIMKKYFPYVTAQKNIFKIGKHSSANEVCSPNEGNIREKEIC